MILLGLLVAAAMAIGSYFSWCYIHEISHVKMAKYLVGIKWYQIKLYPHVDKEAGFRWASCKYMYERMPTEKEEALISLAPRLAGIVACAIAPLAALISIWSVIPALIWLIFWGAGVVDLIVGSLGLSIYSDLRKAADSFGINPWLIRPLMLLALPTLTVISLYVIAFLMGF